ncbi:uncharacterized protein MELLADRAFT_95365 [Melampsora larici-populina 98AG31]|uniref:Uncharacterized protein n=1 Tax=Melampsora larici-populina (strain 98AG31 / pathotype 3-4-7) TaxID=747676 RepID=F4RD62_MELLP|nr:uncharacterized protein MELLADRAFT_95365 [Melampsora larici-populina 98AG31]EGG09873.1 hypothetical protein MELLADRAFT_95365 [Melampsora larici-populina 98AG31]
MANNGEKATNTETFNAMLRRSSRGLRGGSVPPPDSEIIVPAVQVANIRSRGRGGGPTSTRGSRSPARGVTPVVTLTVPGSGPDTSSSLPPLPPAEPQGNAVPNAQTGAPLSGTSVLHSAGLISRDNVIDTPSQQSPTRRNTVSDVGESPPRGFHLWLKAKGLTVVNNATPAITSIQNVSSALANTTTPLSQISAAATPAVPSRVRTPADKTRIQVDLTKDDTPSTSDKVTVEVGKAGIGVNGLVALSPHFESKMKPMDGYIPLSVFNTMWLKQELMKYSLRNKKDKKDDEKYTGLAIPDEWKMSFGEWVTAFDLFLAYLRHYNHNGDLLPRWAEINPYSDGQPKSHINPISGEVMNYNSYNTYNVTTPSGNGLHATHHGKPNARSWQHANQHSNHPVYDGPGSSSYAHYEDRRNSGRNVRGRGRGGGWVSHGRDGRDGRDGRKDRNGGSRDNDLHDNCRGEGGNSWRRDNRRDDRKGDTNGPKYGGSGKAK